MVRNKSGFEWNDFVFFFTLEYTIPLAFSLHFNKLNLVFARLERRGRRTFHGIDLVGPLVEFEQRIEVLTHQVVALHGSNGVVDALGTAALKRRHNGAEDVWQVVEVQRPLRRRYLDR